ncbi:MAG: BMC domain-containing protein [Peptoniphilus sp. oral taxon 375]|uniref:BMC domain-containing protein n=1 Tax=Urinicoccus timonensis TaxID=2024205 RepID=UPI00021A3080|nr:BMC domain-containing protein [Urinicoccus timonensis]EGS30244.1 BMC domain protein [Peptoniphilus sp. oral taxon 375 str. F0436]MBS4872330.1 BMC domain-containing protein [Peptoniphilus sp. oral taxon 375]
MDIRLIKRPSQGTLEIIENRSRLSFKNKKPGALGLVQGKVVEMVCAADIAEKASGVEVGDVRGSCPQNFIILAIVGEMADVSEALRQIQAGIDEMKNF